MDQGLEGVGKIADDVQAQRRVGEHGLLYGSVTALDVVEELKKLGYTVERRKVSLRDHIKEVGDYDVTIKLHRDVVPTIKVKVRKEGAEDQPVESEAADTESAVEASSSAADESAEVAAEQADAEAGMEFVAADEAESAQE